jgi:hypothetical protein
VQYPAPSLFNKGDDIMRREDKVLVIENSQIYRYYRERLINIALAQFEWHGLPDTCDRLYFEKSLLFNGKACMCKPTGTDFWLSLDYIYKGRLDVYGYPTDIRGVGFGSHNLIETDEWEILFDNMTFASLMPMIDLYAKLLWEIHNTYRSNLQQQITPYIVATNRNKELSFKNFFNRLKGYQPVITVSDASNLEEEIKTIDLNVDFKGTDILNNLKVIWAEALSMLGITAETTKKERLLNDEITLDRQEDMISLNSRLLNRVEFCNKMNAKHGLDLSVNLSSETMNMAQELNLDYSTALLKDIPAHSTFSTNYEKGGDDNG